MNTQNLHTSRQAAIHASAKYYMPVMPCIRGHIAPRQALSGTCTECAKTRRERDRENKRRMIEVSPGRHPEPVPAGGWPTTASEAKRLGLGKFNTGKPCKRGHMSDRRTYNGSCIQCKQERNGTARSIKPVSMRVVCIERVMNIRDKILAAARDRVTITDIITALPDYVPSNIENEIQYITKQGGPLERFSDGTLQSKMVIDESGRPVFGKSRNMSMFNSALASVRKGSGNDEKACGDRVRNCGVVRMCG